MESGGFKLGTFHDAGRRFVGLVIGATTYDLSRLPSQLGRTAAKPLAAMSLLQMLADWDRNFELLQELSVDVAARDGMDDAQGIAFTLDGLDVLAPIIRPPKMLCAAANYAEHSKGMQKTFTSNLPTVAGALAEPDRAKLRPYMFLKAGNTLAESFDDILLPPGMMRLDWEAELGVVISRRGKNVPAERAMDHVAGFVAFNDVSCRDHTWREDRPGLRSDWLGGKSWDTFAPMGPYFVPRAFVENCADLRIWCSVNGETKQDGTTGDMIFSTEEQIAYAANMLTLEPGDVIATGTPAGTGQERLEFLKPGDVVEVEVGACGRQRNRIVAGSTEYSAGIAAPS